MRRIGVPCEPVTVAESSDGLFDIAIRFRRPPARVNHFYFFCSWGSDKWGNRCDARWGETAS